MTMNSTLKRLLILLCVLVPFFSNNFTPAIARAENVQLSDTDYLVDFAFDKEGLIQPDKVFALALDVISGRTKWNTNFHVDDDILGLLEDYKNRGIEYVLKKEDQNYTLSMKVFDFLYGLITNTHKKAISDDAVVYATNSEDFSVVEKMAYKSLFNSRKYIDFAILDWTKEDPSREAFLDNLINILSDEVSIRVLDEDNVKMIEVNCPVFRHDSESFSAGHVFWENPDNRTPTIIEDKTPGETSLFSVKWGNVALESVLYRTKTYTAKYNQVPYLRFYIPLDKLEDIGDEITPKTIEHFMLDIVDRIELVLSNANFIWPKSKVVE